MRAAIFVNLWLANYLIFATIIGFTDCSWSYQGYHGNRQNVALGQAESQSVRDQQKIVRNYLSSNDIDGPLSPQPSRAANETNPRLDAMTLASKLTELDHRLRSSSLTRLPIFIRRTERLIKKLRRRRMFFFDTMVLKGQHFARKMAADGEEMSVGISEDAATLESAIANENVRERKLRYIVKKVRHKCWPEKVVKFQDDVTSRVSHMRLALDDLVQEYNL